MAELRLALDAERRRNAELEAHAERVQRGLRQEAEEQRMRALFVEKVRACACFARSARPAAAAHTAHPAASVSYRATRTTARSQPQRLAASRVRSLSE